MTRTRRKISQRLPGVESLREKKVVSYKGLLRINGTSFLTFQEAAVISRLILPQLNANSELCDFQISTICPQPSFIIKTQAESLPDPDEIGNLIEAVVDFVRQINSEVDCNDVNELRGLNNQELTNDELTEMLK
ncbi:hypothetical protein TNCV_1479571 [Trichonephila clavipes]|nr:hypothetical protein TNCV_1479571 [Trichonephila clavipes]